MKCKNVVILGSTGSIGINTLKVIACFPGRFKVIGLTAYNNVKLLEEQVRLFKPQYIAIGKKYISYFQKVLDTKKIKIFDVENGLDQIVAEDGVDIVVVAMRGSAALKPFLSALRHGKTVAPANKEALVVAGDLIIKEAKKYNAKIIPIDSEQSAIFQCLNNANRNELKRIYLTASGGCLLKTAKEKFNQLSREEILKHPRWKMGKKITVDSATLMNKGFEVIEAKHLFSVDVDRVQVVIHPEAVIHSMVEFIDGSIMAQLGVTDMRIPIQYALTYPERWPSRLKSINFFELEQLTFLKPDYDKFPSLRLAIQAGKEGGTLPCVLNAADEEAVDAFLKGDIVFTKIYEVVEKVVRKHKRVANPDIKEILQADGWAREEAQAAITKRG